MEHSMERGKRERFPIYFVLMLKPFFMAIPPASIAGLQMEFSPAAEA